MNKPVSEASKTGSAAADVQAEEHLHRINFEFHSALLQGDLKRMERALKAGANLELCSVRGWRPLHTAAEEGDVKTCRWLVAAGAQVDAPTNDDFRITALHIAASSGKAEVCRCLVEQGADLNAQSTGGKTPLHYAVHMGASSETIIALLELGADPFATNSLSRSAAYDALAYGKPSVILSFRAVGVDFSSVLTANGLRSIFDGKDKALDSAKEEAIQMPMGHALVRLDHLGLLMRALDEHRVDPLAVDRSGRDLLRMASEESRPHFVEALNARAARQRLQSLLHCMTSVREPSGP